MTISRTSTATYGSHEIHLRKPRSEFSRLELIQIDMHIVLNAAWSGDPHRHLSAFHQMKDRATVAALIIGGKPMAPGASLFVLIGMKENHTHWLRQGELIRTELDLTFQEYIPFTPEYTPGGGFQ
jgi:hypothetical protein